MSSGSRLSPPGPGNIHCLVETAITGRQRKAYREAARPLQRMQPLYRRLKAEGEWKAYIRSLASQHRKLPALQDELRAAGIGS